MPRTRKPNGNVSPTESAAGTLLQGLQLITALLVAKGVPVDKIGQGLCRLATDEGLASREKIAEIIFRLTHVIDLNQKSQLHPGGWTFVEHFEQGLFVWDPEEILTFSLGDEYQPSVSGYSVKKMLSDDNQIPWNASLASYLNHHRYLIPEEWEGKKVHFFGTTIKRPFSSGQTLSSCDEEVATLCQKSYWDKPKGWPFRRKVKVTFWTLGTTRFRETFGKDDIIIVRKQH